VGDVTVKKSCFAWSFMETASYKWTPWERAGGAIFMEKKIVGRLS
jgi:hypothetical protein